jgi:hypothetical protein
MQPRLLWLLSAVTLSLAAVFSAPVSANDAAYRGAAFDLSPVKQTAISMVTETIRITHDDRGDPWSRKGLDRWVIDANYVFRNRTNEPVRVQMGFPEYPCAENECNHGRMAFLGLRTTVRGEPVEHRLGEDQGSGKRRGKSRVHLFDVEFAPRETIKIRHRYRMRTSISTEARPILRYVTKTGAHWRGPIARARFIIRLPRRPFAVLWPKAFELVSEENRFVRGKYYDELIFEARDWTPDDDFVATFALGHALLDVLGCIPLKNDLASAREIGADLLRVCSEVDDHRRGKPLPESLRAKWLQDRPGDSPIYPLYVEDPDGINEEPPFRVRIFREQVNWQEVPPGEWPYDPDHLKWLLAMLEQL